MIDLREGTVAIVVELEEEVMCHVAKSKVLHRGSKFSSIEDPLACEVILLLRSREAIACSSDTCSSGTCKCLRNSHGMAVAMARGRHAYARTHTRGTDTQIVIRGRLGSRSWRQRRWRFGLRAPHKDPLEPTFAAELGGDSERPQEELVLGQRAIAV